VSGNVEVVALKCQFIFHSTKLVDGALVKDAGLTPEIYLLQPANLDIQPPIDPRLPVGHFYYKKKIQYMPR